ncbi:unnamed protein product [Schistocephalus solidus]|uniref:Uncharacterized protein n=1 Tax=Schistocephalus solidus TaxID=70667 RepID=A0A183T486_SCHSO|nr:unnamed protein product [Schistocephalus solidus]
MLVLVHSRENPFAGFANIICSTTTAVYPRALSRAKLCSQTIFSVDGDRIGDCSGNNIDCVTKLGNLKETSQYSSSSRSGHKSRIDADGPCMETPPRTGILELPHKEGTADPTMDRKIKSILRKTGQTLFGVSTPLPFLSGTERFGFEPERQREQLTVPCRSASRGNTPPVLGGDRWTVTASPKELPKCQSPGHQARPNTGGLPETLKRSRASISANRRVITTTTTQKTLAPPPPHPPRPSLVLPLRSPRNPSTTGQTYVLIHNRTSHYQKQRNISPVLLTPTSARRRISTSPVACSGGQTRAKTHSPAWQDLRPNHLHQRPLTVRTTCGSGKKGQQHQQQTLPLFRPLYASVFEC